MNRNNFAYSPETVTSQNILRKYANAAFDVQYLKRQLEVINDRLSAGVSIKLDQEPVDHSRSTNANYAILIEKKVDIERKIDSIQADYLAVDAMLEAMTDTERLALIECVGRKRSPVIVADEYYMSEKKLRYVRNAAIKKFTEMRNGLTFFA